MQSLRSKTLRPIPRNGRTCGCCRVFHVIASRRKSYATLTSRSIRTHTMKPRALPYLSSGIFPCYPAGKRAGILKLLASRLEDPCIYPQTHHRTRSLCWGTVQIRVSKILEIDPGRLRVSRGGVESCSSTFQVGHATVRRESTLFIRSVIGGDRV